MDLNESFLDLTNKKFTDVDLILIDSNNKIKLNCHKFILIFSSKYFYNLFSIGCDKDKSEIQIHVNDAKIAHDIIMSFYNQKNKFHSLS